MKSVLTLTAATLVILVNGCAVQKKADLEIILKMAATRNAGIAFLEENDLNEAESAFKRLIRIAPDEIMGYANLGLIYLRSRRYAEAEVQFTQALKLDHHNPDVRLNLTEVFKLTDRDEDVLRVLEETIEYSPHHSKTLYRLAQLYLRSNDAEILRRGKEYLTQVVNNLPANIAVRLQLIEILIRGGAGDTALEHLEELRRQMPKMPEESVEFFREAISMLEAFRIDDALLPAMRFHNLVKRTLLYRSGILDLESFRGPFVGSPILTFAQDASFREQAQTAIFRTIRFVDVTSDVGLDVVQSKPEQHDSNADLGAAIAVADYDLDGNPDLYVSMWAPDKNESLGLLLRNESGRFVEYSPEINPFHPGRDLQVIFADYDNDGYLDLFTANSGSNLLLRNNADAGVFHDVAASADVVDSGSSVAGLWADFDHDGDIDLYLASDTTNRFYRNNLDGTFTERSEAMGIGGGDARSRDAAFGDFDDDGDLDLYVVNEDTSNILYTNMRQGRFKDITEESGLTSRGKSGAVTVGDYNNDGSLDFFVTALEDGKYHLYRNTGNGTFHRETRQRELFGSLKHVAGQDAVFFDFDNDGYLDLIVVGRRGVFLFHNDGTGKFEDVSTLLPGNTKSGSKIIAADYDYDGDLDVFIAGWDGAIRLLRNDGGNANRFLKLQLVGLRAGSGKNNYYGIGAKIEVKSEDLYQMRVSTGPTTHFGLGQRLQTDAVRILWPNGVPQNIFYQSGNERAVEEQILKGSCAFLYAWNGREYSFVTDILWRSALGMPLGIMGGTMSYAFSDSTKEYLRIPGQALKAHNGKYAIQITEELWESAYFDALKLIAIDHPETIDVFVDERFMPPPLPPLYIRKVADRRSPISAIDERHTDLLLTIGKKDDVYVSNLVPAGYQGITQQHDIILDLGDLNRDDRIVLFMNGWIFPTDAGINVAIAQSSRILVIPPHLQVLDDKGHWQTVVENLSFPMGKNKYVIIDLSDKFITDDYRVRIRTNMQIYWDYVFFTTEDIDIPIFRSTLEPISADIHYRGFSRPYRKGGRYGPHWFSYGEVTVEPKWRDLVGYYTRYGNVLPLLLESDDKYVIVNSGDEMTIEFDASRLPHLETGWTRDFLLYSDGWLKDGDLNTAKGRTVNPLPFHEMSKYPYDQDESYPQDEEHREYLETYNTREVTTREFRELLLRAAPVPER